MLTLLVRHRHPAISVSLRAFSAKLAGPRPFPPVDGFIRQNRPGEREVVDIFRPKNGGNEIRIERVDEHDLELCAQMTTDVFVQSCQMFTQLGIGYAESFPFWHKIARPCVREGRATLLAFDGDKLVSHVQGRTQSRTEYAKNYRGGLHLDKPKLEFLPDYGHLVAESPWATRDMNCVQVCYYDAVEQAGKFIPRDVEVLHTGEVMATHHAYHGTGITQHMLKVHTEIIREMKVDYCVGFCLVRGSAAVLRNVGYHDMFEFPYKRFKVDGKLVWDTLADGATGVYGLGMYVR